MSVLSGNDNLSLRSNAESGLHKRDEIIRKTENLHLMLILILVVSVIFISFGLRLVAGVTVILAAATGVLIYRKWGEIISGRDRSIQDQKDKNARKDTIIKDFSHRIREPLNNLVIISDILMESGLNKEQKDLLGTLIASTNNMVSTLNELTMESAGNISQEARKPIRFNLASTIKNTIDLYSHKTEARISVSLSGDYEDDLEFTGDPIIIKQLFLLLFNEIEARSADLPTAVIIRIRRLSSSNGESVVQMTLETDRDMVFIGSNGPETVQAVRIIRAANGTFREEKKEGLSVLITELPLTEVSENIPKTPSSRIEELIKKEKIRKELKDLRILLVDDNLINQKITTLTLKSFVSSIDTASNGKEALDKFGTSGYDLILMDIQMPQMSGLVAAEKIRALELTTHTHIPIIAITANAMIGDKERCLQAGIDDYIAKPFQPAELLDMIKQLI